MFQTTQTGRVILGTFVIGTILITASLVLRHRQQIKKYRFLHVLVMVILCLMMISSYNLKITVDQENFKFAFGPGLFYKTISLADIQDCEVVENKWRFGYGIRRIKGAWLYNVSGLDAISLTIKDKKNKIRVGTYEPEAVCDAVSKNILLPE